jgi:hypothetical protein
MAASDLRYGRNGKFTSASLRDYFCGRVATLAGADRSKYAFNVLSSMLSADSKVWTRSQIKAAAEGLRLGMDDEVPQ